MPNIAYDMSAPSISQHHRKIGTRQETRLLIITFDPPENIGEVEGKGKGYVAELERRGEFVEVEALAPVLHSLADDFFC
jgi:hypothetical protein